AGSTVRIYFTSTQGDATNGTAFFVDDINLTINTSVPTPSFDINGDTKIDAYDLLEFLKRYGSTAAGDLAAADFNTDGQINDTDLNALLAAL
ncbi:MAG: dockerin type I domain-containing protein, partial [Holophaga sp.]